MTRIEKQMIGVVVVCISLIGFSVHTCSQAIEEYGGMTKIIIDTGKAAKHISKEIDKE